MADAITQLDAGARVDAVIHRDEQRLREVQKAHACAAVSPLARDCRFNASDSAVVVRILRLYAFFDEARDNHLVVVEGRHAEAAGNDVHAFAHKRVRQSVMISYGQIRLSQMTLGDAF